MSEELHEVRDRLAVLNTLFEYCRLGDLWDDAAKAQWYSTVSPNLEIRYGDLGDYNGRDAFFKMADDYHTQWTATHHIVFSPTVTIDGDEATSVAPHTAVHVPLDGGTPVEAGVNWFHRYRREEGCWVIVSASTEFVWSDNPDVIPGSAWAKAREAHSD